MRFPLRRLACALALALSAPAGAGGTEHVADGWAEGQARLARVLSIVEPAAAEKPPAAPKTQVLTAPGVSAANEGGVVDTLAAGIAPERKPPATMVCMQGAPDGPLDLALVAGQVLCNHPKTAAAWAKARAEAARVELARAAWQPNAQANVAYSHSSSSYSKPIKDEVTARTLNLELKLSWLFYDFGTRRANFDSAVAVLDAAHATRNATVQQVLFEASQAWFEVRAAQAQLIAAREAVRAARDSLATAQARFDAGAAARLDVLQAANAHAQARLKQAQAESAQRNALGALAVKMGLPAETPLSLVPAEGAPARWEAPGSVASLIAEASLHHPSLRAARHELDALAARVGVARAEGLPSLFGTAGYHRNRDF